MYTREEIDDKASTPTAGYGESVSIEFTQKSWWRRSKYIRYVFYGISVMVEGFIAGSYLYGYGGGTTVFDLGVANSAVLSVAVFNIASLVLVACGIAYQMYQMRKNEIKLEKSTEESIQKQKEHLSFEYRYYLMLMDEYKCILIKIDKEKKFDEDYEIDDETISKLNFLYSNLEKISDRLAIYHVDINLEPEVQRTQGYHDQAILSLLTKTKQLQEQITKTLNDHGVPSPAKDLMPFLESYESKPQVVKPESTIDVPSLVYKTILAFLYITAAAASTACLFSTPLGWLAVAGVIIGTGVYLFAEYANTRIENKISQMERLNTQIDLQRSAAQNDLRAYHRHTATMSRHHDAKRTPQKQPSSRLSMSKSASVYSFKTISPSTQLESPEPAHDVQDAEPLTPESMSKVSQYKGHFLGSLQKRAQSSKVTPVVTPAPGFDSDNEGEQHGSRRRKSLSSSRLSLTRSSSNPILRESRVVSQSCTI